MKLAPVIFLFTVGYVAALLPVVFQTHLSVLVLCLSAELAGLLITLSAIDAVWLVLPNLLTGLVAVSGVVAAASLGTTSLALNLASAAVAGAFLKLVNALYRKIRGRDGLGGGDAKLVAAVAVWLGPLGLPTLLLWACLTAIAEVLVRSARYQQLSLNSRIPFGPHLAFGAWLVWLYGPLQ